MNRYVLRKIKKFLWFTWSEFVFDTCNVDDIGIYMWGRDLRDYKFIKNGREIELKNKERIELANLDKLVKRLEEAQPKYYTIKI